MATDTAFHTLPIPKTLDDARYEPFNAYDFIYKFIHDIAIPATVLVPKNLSPGKYPVLVRWHGGFLITGARTLTQHAHKQ
jgi:cephalosporin-C deacetylase-like acetyl esterase